MERVPDLLVVLAFCVLFLASRRARRGNRPGPRPIVPCMHDWGMAEASTGWGQKFAKCGAWKSGYGKTWR